MTRLKALIPPLQWHKAMGGGGGGGGEGGAVGLEGLCPSPARGAL